MSPGRLHSLAARTAIAFVLIGIPALLIAVAWNPIPTAAQVEAMLQLEPDWGNTVLLTSLLPCVAWAAWAVFAYPLLAELVERWLGRRVLPIFSPLRLQHHVASALVAAAVIGGTAGIARGAEPGRVVTVSETADRPLEHLLDEDVALTGTDRESNAITTIARGTQSEHLYRVREGDTLWDIADSRLGSGADYPEIVAASTRIEQSDGRHLTNPDLILPGWQLAIPARPKSPAATVPSVQSERPSHAATQSPRAGARSAPQTPTLAPAPRHGRVGDESGVEGRGGTEESDTIKNAGGAVTAGLLAAGLVAVLARRRRRQRAARQLGQRLSVQEVGDVADLELQLRTVADPDELHDVHQALQLVGDATRAAKESLPELFAVRVDDIEIALYLHRPTALTAPWRSVFDDNTVWTMPRGALSDVGEGSSVFPYPALVTIGTDLDGGTLLLDLEQQTTLDVVSPESSDLVKQLLNAIATELATTPWGDHLHLSLVDIPEHLAAQLDPYRIHRVSGTHDLCRDLRVHLADRRAVLDSHGIPDIRTARVFAAEIEAWAPFVVLVGNSPSSAEQDELDALAREHACTGLVVVQRRDVSLAPSSIELETEFASYRSVGADGPPLPFIPQLVSDDFLEDALRLFELADAAPFYSPNTPNMSVSQPGSQASADHRWIDIHDLNSTGATGNEAQPEPSAADPSDHETVRTSAPYVRILGPISIDDVERAELMPGRGVEFITYLLHHRQPIPGAQLQKALWPNTYDTSNNNTRTLAKQVRAALGHDPDGHLWLPEGKGPKGFSTHAALRSDWVDFNDLVGDLDTATTDNIARALRLVRGQPFLGAVQRGRWAWRGPLEESIIAGVLDAAELLGARALQANDQALTRLAVSAARLIDPLSEVAWRIELRVALHRRSASEVERIEQELFANVGYGEPDYQPDAETALLIEAAKDLPRS